jgi:hypothetical protein
LNYQTRPPGPIRRKPTHTFSNGDALAPFIHGKDGMPQRSTPYTRKVLALTPRQGSVPGSAIGSIVACGMSALSGPRLAGLRYPRAIAICGRTDCRWIAGDSPLHFPTAALSSVRLFFPGNRSITKRLLSTWRMHEDFSSFAFYGIRGSGVSCHARKC